MHNGESLRRWQDRCVEVRLASQALLTRELARLGISGRRRLVESWSTFLPTLLDPTLSIFGSRTLVASMNTALPSTGTNPKPPPIPPRTSQISLPDTTLQGIILLFSPDISIISGPRCDVFKVLKIKTEN